MGLLVKPYIRTHHNYTMPFSSYRSPRRYPYTQMEIESNGSPKRYEKSVLITRTHTTAISTSTHPTALRTARKVPSPQRSNQQSQCRPNGNHNRSLQSHVRTPTLTPTRYVYRPTSTRARRGANRERER